METQLINRFFRKVQANTSGSRKVLLFVVVLLVLSLTGCFLSPSTIDKGYVKNCLENRLHDLYGVTFMVEVTYLDENSELRESTAVAWPENDPSMSFEVKGSIHYSSMDGGRALGSNYGFEDISFGSTLLENVYAELASEYSFEIGKGADYNVVASNFREYMKHFRLSLDDYKDGKDVRIRSCMHEKYPQVIVPFTLDGEDISKTIMYNIRDENIVVAYDTVNGADAWRADMDIEEYLQLLSNGTLDETVAQIRNEHYGRN